MAGKINKETIVKKSAGAASRIIDGEAVVVSGAEGMVRVLNESGSLIWDFIDGERDVGALSRALEKRFAISGEAALADVEDFIGELLDKKMVRIV